MKIFMESLDKGIWDAIENDPFIPTFEKMVLSLRSHGLNGLMQKVERPNSIALPKIL